MRMKKTIILILIGIIGVLGYYVSSTREVISEAVKHPVATIKLQGGECLEMELYPECAPNTVANFIDLANSGFYNGTKVSRLVLNELVQLGDPIGDGTGFPGYFIRSECKQNGFRNRLKCIEGTVCMARSEKYDTEGCQFFVLLEDNAGLNGRYSSFARITKGLDTLKHLSTKPVGRKYTPLEEIKIVSVVVETYEVVYNEPECLAVLP